MGEFKELQVGDTVWFDGIYTNSHHRYLTVAKRGRKYITFEGTTYRAEIGSRAVHSSGFVGLVGRLYESPEELELLWQQRNEKRALLEKLVSCLRDQSLDTLRAIDGLIEKAKESENANS